MSSITVWGGQTATKYLTAYPNPRGRRTSRLHSQVTHHQYQTQTPTDNVPGMTSAGPGAVAARGNLSVTATRTPRGLPREAREVHRLRASG